MPDGTFNLPLQIASVIRNKSKTFNLIAELICQEPQITNFSTTVINHQSITISFNLQNSTTHSVKQKKSTDSLFDLIWVSDANGSGDKYYTISNLVAETEYVWIVEQSNQSTNCNICTVTSSVTQNTTCITEEEPIGDCPLPKITDLKTTLIQHNKFTINFNIDSITYFQVYYKQQSSEQWISLVSGEIGGTKKFTVDNLTQNTQYQWKVYQKNEDIISGCNFTEYTTNINDSNTKVVTVACIPIKTQPTIIFPTINTNIYQNQEIEIKFEESNGTGALYNIYINNINVLTEPLYTNKYIYKFQNIQDYVIQIGQINSCTLEEIKSNTLTIQQNKIIPCTSLNGIINFVTPIETSIIVLNTPYTIRWTAPQGTNIKYNVYLITESEDVKINLMPLENPYIDYTFTQFQRYQIKVVQTNPCSTTQIEKTTIIDFSNFTIEQTTELDILCTYGDQPGTEIETNFLPLFGKDSSPLSSVVGNRIRIPTTETSIKTSFERWFRIRCKKLQQGKKIKNFKVYVSTNKPTVGCTLYYKTTNIYQTPQMYVDSTFLTNNEFSLLQESDLNCNLYINNSQSGEIILENTKTDFGVILSEITYEQIGSIDYIIYITYDELDL